MRAEDYPPQEPFSDFAKPYVEEVTRRGAGVEPTREARYGEDAYQSIAVHEAAAPTGDVLVFVHGGGWTSGYKEHMNFIAPAFTAQGVTFCSVGYRLAPRHLFPAGLEDLADGLAWIHANIGDHGGDPGRLFAGGHSAGGHYMPLLAVRTDWQARRHLPDDVIRGCLPVSGVYRFGAGSGLSMRPRFLGPEGTDAEAQASPLNFVTAGVPPFLIAWGSADFPHLKEQGARMVAALREAGVEAESLVLDGRDHFGACFACGEPDGPWVRRALAWMAEH